MRATSISATDPTPLVRLGGLGGFLCVTLFILINWVIKEFPPPQDSPLVELQAYFSREAGAWALVHGLRYVVFACYPFFVAGLFWRIQSRGVPAANGWALVGLIGSAVLLASGLVTNSVETYVFLNDGFLSENPTLFWMLFRVTRVVFTGVTLAWGLVLLGFSLAGWRSGSMPRWLVALGIAGAGADILHAVFIVSVLNGGWATHLSTVAGLSLLAWTVSVSLQMMLRGTA